MQYRFYTCDVFTAERFGGNQLAVLTNAEGLSDRQMQQVAAEFNYSETTFVLPAEHGQTNRVRIFTPAREVPFAGHPNIGTAFVLARTGAINLTGRQTTITFEEDAGVVPVTIFSQENDSLRCELQAPQKLKLGPVVMPEMAAAALSLDVKEIRLETHPPQVAGVGLPFLIVELSGSEALAQACFNTKVMESFVQSGISPDILLYVRDGEKFDIRCRMFAPLDGVPEDPATGSANCALAALLGQCDPATNGDFSWRIAQGVEMGRPSTLEARVCKKDGKVTATYIGGDCVMVSEGNITIE